MRDGRYCIPIKSEYKGQVPGMVHDQSSTGSTFFVEPMAVVKLNNDIRELEIEEAKEIEVILSTLSAQADLHRDEIRYDLENMVELDFIFARAALAMEQNANEPIFNTEGKIHLRKARHPLINAKKVVPIDLSLGEDFDLLIVTGPNTGGKTVSLKTVSACRIPASGEKTTAFSGPGASAVRAVCGAGGHEKYNSGTCKTAKFGNDEHFRSGRAFNGGRTDTVFCGSAVLFYSRYKM